MQKSAISLIVFILTFFMVGCGDGGGESYVSATSTSYSPIRAIGDSGKSVALSWTYRLNIGKLLILNLKL